MNFGSCLIREFKKQKHVFHSRKMIYNLSYEFGLLFYLLNKNEIFTAACAKMSTLVIVDIPQPCSNL